jgi:Amt family ammonium transporter
MICATTFVMLQTPACGLLQAGLVRRKNSLSVIGQSLCGLAIGSILWYMIGFSLTFGPSQGGFIGDPSTYVFWRGVELDECFDIAPTIPKTLYASFQMMFALMVPVIITGAWAEKFSFEAFCIFVVAWPFLVYYPVAHWVCSSVVDHELTARCRFGILMDSWGSTVSWILLVALQSTRPRESQQ